MSDAAHTPPGDQAAASPADKEMTRGQFLTAATVGVGGLMGALIAAPVAGMALGPVFGGDDFEPVFVGKLDEFKEGSFTKVVLTPHAGRQNTFGFCRDDARLCSSLGFHCVGYGCRSGHRRGGPSDLRV